jgi:hypothetical protein
VRALLRVLDIQLIPVGQMSSSAPPKRRVIATDAGATPLQQSRLQRPPSRGKLKARVDIAALASSSSSSSPSPRPPSPKRSGSPIARHARSPYGSTSAQSTPTARVAVVPQSSRSLAAINPSSEHADSRRRTSLGSTLPSSPSRHHSSPSTSMSGQTSTSARLFPPPPSASLSDPSSPLSPTPSITSTSSSSSGIRTAPQSSIPRPVSPVRRPGSPSRPRLSPMRPPSPTVVTGGMAASPSPSLGYSIFGNHGTTNSSVVSPTFPPPQSPTAGELELADLDLSSIPKSEWNQRLKEVEAAREREREARVNRKASFDGLASDPWW